MVSPVTITIGNIISEIVGNFPRYELSDRFAFDVPNAFWIKRSKGLHQWDGKHRFVKVFADRVLFPTGLLPKILKFFKQQNIHYTLTKLPEVYPVWINNLPESISPQLPHGLLYLDQQEVVELALKKKRGCFELVTGYGKTMTISAIAYHLQKAGCPLTLIFVHREKLLKQTSQDLKRLTGLPIGIIGEDVDGKRVWHEQPITIATIQTLYSQIKQTRTQQLLVKAGALLFDEGHHISAKTWLTVSKYATHAPIRFAFSGSLFDEENPIDNYSLVGVCGPRLKTITAQDLLQLTDHNGNPRITWPEVCMYEINLPQLDETTPYMTAYSQGITDNLILAQIVVILTHILITDGRKVLTLVEHRKHLGLILEAISLRGTPFQYSFATGLDTKGGDCALEAFKQDKIQNIIATTTLEEGINVPAISALIRVGGLKTINKTKQQAGRALRYTPTKKSPIIIDFLHLTHPILHQHSLKRKKDYENMGWTVKVFSWKYVQNLLKSHNGHPFSVK